MNDIYKILADAGITLPDEKKEAFEKDFHANYKTVAELNKKNADLEEVRTQLQTAKDSLKAFDGVNVDEFKTKIKNLEDDLAKRDADYAAKVADMEFSGELETAIGAAKGRNAKAIRALLDIDTLKKSQNRKEDVKNALESLKKDNAYLFEEETTPPPFSTGAGKSNPKTGKYDALDRAFRRGAGLPDEE